MKRDSGFTLLELLLYAGASATILTVALGFQLTFFKASSSTMNVDDVMATRIDLRNQLRSDINSASSISIPSSDNTSENSLELVNANGETFRYSLVAGAIFRQKTSPTVGPMIRITPPESRVISASFRRVNNGFSDGVKYQFEISPSPRVNSDATSLSVIESGSEVILR
jgi:hypothetical protein